MLDKIQGIKVLGYLISTTLKSTNISVEDFNNKIADLNLSPKNYSSSDIVALRMEQRRPSDAYKQSLKTAKSYDNKTENTRYYLRPPASSDKALKVFVIREKYDYLASGTRDSIGSIHLNEDGDIIAESDDPTSEEQFDKIAADVKDAYQHELKIFNSTSLKHRFAAIINECLPFYYDAEHNFKFISFENKSRIDLISDTVDIVNEMSGLKDETRENKSSMSILPIPDISMSREVIAQSFQGTIADSLKSAQSILDESLHSQGDAKKILDAINRTKNIVEVMKAHKGSLAVVTSGAEKAILSVQDNLRKILGDVDSKSEKRNTGWKSARKRLNIQQVYLGDALSEGVNFDVIAKAHMECITFLKSDNESVKLIQSGLTSEDSITLSIKGIETIPEELSAIGFSDSITGITYSSSYDVSELDIVAGWWNSIF